MSADALASPTPLAGADAEILKYLAQIVAIGRNRNAWDSAAVVRVAEAHLPNPRALRRQLINERARATAAEQELAELRTHVRRLRARVQNLEANATSTPAAPTPARGPASRTVHLAPTRNAVLELMKTGATVRQIAQQLGITDSAATNRIWRVATDLGAHSRAEAIALVLSGQVAVHVKNDDRRAA